MTVPVGGPGLVGHRYAALEREQVPGHDRDALRSYTLEVDGIPRGKIKSAQVVTVDAEPGRHTVRARISWTGSPRQEVSLGPDDEVRLRVEPAGTPAQALWQVVADPVAAHHDRAVLRVGEPSRDGIDVRGRRIASPGRTRPPRSTMP